MHIIVGLGWHRRFKTLYVYRRVGAGWQRRCKTFQPQPGFRFFLFWRSLGWFSSRSYYAGWRTLTPHKGNDQITQCEHGEAPTRQLSSNSHCCLWIGHTRKQSNSLALPSISKKVSTRCRSPSYERFLEGCRPPFMRLAEHPTALRAWCKQCLLGGSKPDVLRAGIVGMRGSIIIRLRQCTN